MDYDTALDVDDEQTFCPCGANKHRMDVLCAKCYGRVLRRLHATKEYRAYIERHRALMGGLLQIASGYMKRQSSVRMTRWNMDC